jgi:peptidoglycan/LPS O-acetylase OafA/YrhL
MTNALSLYLDVLRFGAAFTVFLSHYSAERISGGLFWHVADYGRAAVLLFFVLSGFVIAWVSETRERNLEDFALSRVARLYSVVVPALIATAVLDHFGKGIEPTLYGPQLGHGTTHPVLDFMLSVVFLGESWTLAVLPGVNVPFWSLNYEAWYYVFFAAATFLHGRPRAAALVVAALLAGPKILVLFPVWLMGVAAWRWRNALPMGRGSLLVMLSLAAFAGIETLGGQSLFRQSTTPWLPPSYSGYDYVFGALVAVFIAGLANARLAAPGPGLQRLIRWLAGTSFGLYLLHYPLLNFFAAVIPGPDDGAMHRVLVFGLALGVALALAHIVEQRKGALKHWLRAALDAGGFLSSACRGIREIRKRTAP